jgi:hypothetical protein
VAKWVVAPERVPQYHTEAMPDGLFARADLVQALTQAAELFLVPRHHHARTDQHAAGCEAISFNAVKKTADFFSRGGANTSGCRMP